MRVFLLSLLPLVLASGAFHPRQRSLFPKRDICTANGEVDCGNSCMPGDAECCDSDGDYCPYGEYCITGGCCDNGQVCGPGDGSVDTILETGTAAATTSRAATSTSRAAGSSMAATSRTASTATATATSISGSGCLAEEVECGDGCLPAGYTCCPDLLGGCPSGEYCIQDPIFSYDCCPVGESCDGSGNGGGDSITASTTAARVFTASTSGATPTAQQVLTTTASRSGTALMPHGTGNALGVGLNQALMAGGLVAAQMVML